MSKFANYMATLGQPGSLADRLLGLSADTGRDKPHSVLLQHPLPPVASGHQSFHDLTPCASKNLCESKQSRGGKQVLATPSVGSVQNFPSDELNKPTHKSKEAA